MGQVTATLSVNAGKEDSYSRSKSYYYTDATVVKQEVSGSGATPTDLIDFGSVKTEMSLQGFKTLSITNIGETTAELAEKELYDPLSKFRRHFLRP